MLSMFDVVLTVSHVYKQMFTSALGAVNRAPVRPTVPLSMLSQACVYHTTCTYVLTYVHMYICTYVQV